MNIRGLSAFRAVMEFGTVTEAANRLHITQPAMSRLISTLEQDLGFKLFHRRRKRLFPTAEAEVFYRDAQRILAAVDEIPRLARDIRAHVGTRLRIVTMPRAAEGFVVPALCRFAEAYPRVHHTVEVQSRVDIERWVSRQQFDIGVGALPAVHEAIRTEELCRVPAMAVMASNHRLAARPVIPVEELVDEPMVASKPGTMLRRSMDEIMERAGAAPLIRTECGNGVVACQLAGAGVGITICDALTSQSFIGPDAVLVPIEPRFEMVFGVLYPAASRPETVTTAFTEILREIIAEKLAAIGL